MKIIGFDGTPVEGEWGFGARAPIMENRKGDLLTTPDGRTLTRERFAEIADGEIQYVTRIDPPLNAPFTDGVLVYRHKGARAPLDSLLPWQHQGDIAVAYVIRPVAEHWLAMSSKGKTVMNPKLDEVRELLAVWPVDVPIGHSGDDGNVFSTLTSLGVVGVRMEQGRTVLVCALEPTDVMGKPCDWWRRVWKGSPESVQTAIRDAWAKVKDGTIVDYPPKDV
jgi:hypothetical protein